MDDDSWSGDLVKISELIDSLVAVRDAYGCDAEVSRLNTCCCYGDWEEDLTEVKAEQIKGYEPSVVLV